MKEPKVYKTGTIDSLIDALKELKEEGNNAIVGQFVDDNDQAYHLPIEVFNVHGDNNMVCINLSKEHLRND